MYLCKYQNHSFGLYCPKSVQNRLARIWRNLYSKLFQLSYQNLVYLSSKRAQILGSTQYRTLTNTFRNIPMFCPVLVSLIIVYLLRGSNGHAQSHLHAPRCSQDDLGHVTRVNYALQILPSRHSAKSPRHSQRHPRVMAMETGQMWSYQVFKSVRSRL
jgi:hypothetical protein